MIISFTEVNIDGMILQVASTDWLKLVELIDVSTCVFPMKNRTP